MRTMQERCLPVRKGQCEVPDERSRIVTTTRRMMLVSGGATLGVLAAGPDFSRAAECILTSAQIDGPYHI